MNYEQRERILQELFNQATETIIAINQQAEIKLVNPAAEKLFGYTFEELEGKKIEFLMPARFAERHVSHRTDYIENPHARPMGMQMDLYAKRKDDSEFPVEISLSPFNSDGEMFTMAFVIDITKRKQAELEIIKNQEKLKAISRQLTVSNERLEARVLDRTMVLQEALNEIEKSRAELIEALEKEKELNELKSRFLSMASHEFRTPLTTILSSASLIPEYTNSEQQPKRMKHVERIISAVNNLNDILSDFLSLSKIEEGRVSADFSMFNLQKLTAEVIGEMKGTCKKNQTIIYEHSGDEMVWLDPKLSRNILLNLLSNAIKFSPENKQINITTITTQKQTTIRIQDQGIGISKEDQQHLFGRFFRGHNAINIQGTGLGLNIVSKYLELMGGSVKMESEVEKGTIFTVTLPNKQTEKQ
ncbi:MAG: PAS domain-containing sensor histidine kinase [Chitinophagaceae bacterium]|nr:PAS domain-containing sensor histidine kinase [Chitinophagaceae bacterium]